MSWSRSWTGLEQVLGNQRPYSRRPNSAAKRNTSFTASQ
jgi:hypothetical protein